MGRTSLVLALVAAMVTVLVFAVPAFALSFREDVAPPGPQPSDNADVPTPDIAAPDNTIGGLASGEAIDATRFEGPDLGPEAPGFHIIDTTHLTPGEIVQLCRDYPTYPLCT